MEKDAKRIIARSCCPGDIRRKPHEENHGEAAAGKRPHRVKGKLETGWLEPAPR
jgi:hypothetical protein